MRVIDADSHLVEDFDKLHALTDARFLSYAPRLVPHGPSEMLRIGGIYQAQAPGMTWGDTNSRRRAGRRQTSDAQVERSGKGRFRSRRPARADGPSGRGRFGDFSLGGLGVGAIVIPEIAAGVCRGVNRYVAEYCAADPDRLWPAANLPLAGRDVAIEEARHAVEELGAKALFGLSGVHGPERLYHPYWDPFFETVAELGVPFCTHGGGGAVRGGLAAERFPGQYAPYHMTTHTIEAMLVCVGMIANGLFEKWPSLKVGFLEAGAGWMPFWLDRLEEKYAHLGWTLPELHHSPIEVCPRSLRRYRRGGGGGHRTNPGLPRRPRGDVVFRPAAFRLRGRRQSAASCRQRLPAERPPGACARP